MPDSLQLQLPLTPIPFPLSPSLFAECGQFNIVEKGIKITSIRIFALIKQSLFDDMKNGVHIEIHLTLTLIQCRTNTARCSLPKESLGTQFHLNSSFRTI
ncbi:hypothetical protein CEXT_659371 [Caerostris extrusa]|uniref:Uncharacterized protein n=1 Tax=Caerostris extrusa TaxID=172846 RepID=A0AAV4SEI5_CAEEX|nr:hypothetical protein CEXT_659371 [Caerostris extrusa]